MTAAKPKLTPRFLETKDGRKEFVVLPYDEYLAVRAYLDDVEDLILLRQAKRKEGRAKGRRLEGVKESLGA
ncbi:MAG: type II toxin-antitoxin system Phd/YefM family antitoxin [Deltaproteobacteria bacterium]|nr:type II toxin-antitoxin system Phd/YefM family antitoxin [Deltaproteobacteria bacterium]